MNRKTVFYTVLALAAVAAVCAGISYAKDKKYDINAQSVEELAPDFELQDLKGGRVKLSDFRGKKTVLLVFGTTWCSYCRLEIPEIKKIYSDYRKKGIEVLSIDIQESVEKVGAFADKYKLPYTVLLDLDGKVANIYGIRGVPTKILIDKKGMMLCRECRSVDMFLKDLVNEEKSAADKKKKNRKK